MPEQVKQVQYFLMLFLILLIWSKESPAQELKPQGFFLKDSIKLGEPVTYSLSVRYPKGMEMIFPDSTYDFSPFEFLQKDFYPTRSDSTFSFDSVLYRFTTFEVDTVQILELPVFVIKSGDSIALVPMPDSIILNQVVKALPDSLALIENTIYTKVSKQFNYPVLIMIIAGLSILGFLVFILFGNRIKKFFKVRSMNRRYKKFINEFNASVYSYQLDSSFQRGEKTLSVWKAYLENLENFPFTKMTSKEIIANYPNEHLKKSLREIDRSIYGRDHDNVKTQFDELLNFSTDRYRIKLEEVKNGR
jgi:hypothetical protein